MCMFCRSVFDLLFFFFWPLCCRSFFYLLILITTLISSNSSYILWDDDYDARFVSGRQLDFNRANSLKQQPTPRHVARLANILNATNRSQHKLHGLSFDPTGAQTHNIQHFSYYSTYAVWCNTQCTSFKYMGQSPNYSRNSIDYIWKLM